MFFFNPLHIWTSRQFNRQLVTFPKWQFAMSWALWCAKHYLLISSEQHNFDIVDFGKGKNPLCSVSWGCCWVTLIVFYFVSPFPKPRKLQIADCSTVSEVGLKCLPCVVPLRSKVGWTGPHGHLSQAKCQDAPPLKRMVREHMVGAWLGRPAWGHICWQLNWNMWCSFLWWSLPDSKN